jgi:translation elongation factor EF-G
MKTIHTPHGGKLSVARILSGQVADGAELWISGATDGEGFRHLPHARQGADQDASCQGRRHGGARQARRR